MNHRTHRSNTRRAKPPWLAVAGLLLLCALEAHAQASISPGVMASGGGVQTGGFGAMFATIGEPITTDSLGASDETTWGGFWQVLPVSTPAGVDEEIMRGATGATGISRAYPSPFASMTTIEVQLARAGEVRVSVFDMLGREVERLIDGRREAGAINLHWRPDGIESGNYFIRLEVNGRAYGSFSVQYYR